MNEVFNHICIVCGNKFLTRSKELLVCSGECLKKHTAKPQMEKIKETVTNWFNKFK